MTISQATGYRTTDHKTENREGHRTSQDVILRDMDSIPDARNFEVGISVTTMDDSIRNYSNRMHLPYLKEFLFSGPGLRQRWRVLRRRG